MDFSDEIDTMLYPLDVLVTEPVAEVTDEVEGGVPVDLFFLSGKGGTAPPLGNGVGWSLASSNAAKRSG